MIQLRGRTSTSVSQESGTSGDWLIARSTIDAVRRDSNVSVSKGRTAKDDGLNSRSVRLKGLLFLTVISM